MEGPGLAWGGIEEAGTEVGVDNGGKWEGLGGAGVDDRCMKVTCCFLTGHLTNVEL